jgi:Ca2+-binding RTX toxin-like protein
MSGFAGNDSYYVDHGHDTIIEAVGGGYDIVRTSISYILNAGAEVEQLGTTNTFGIDPINLTGNEFGQMIRGNAGNNNINGGTGADTLVGFAGNDNYIVDNPSDVIVEASGGGSDTVRTSVNYILSAGAEVELLGTTNTAGTGSLNLTGNEFSQYILGNNGDNILNGWGGRDTITGNGGHDTFVFNFSPGPNNAATITDFDVSSDQIALSHAVFTSLSVTSELDVSSFAYSSSVTTEDQHIIYDMNAGSVFYDPDGSGSAAALLFANVTPGTALTNHDFFVV